MSSSCRCQCKLVRGLSCGTLLAIVMETVKEWMWVENCSHLNWKGHWNPKGRYPLPMSVPLVESGESILSLCQYHQWNPEGRYPLSMPIPPVESWDHQWNPEGWYPLPMPVLPVESWRKVSSPYASTTSGMESWRKVSSPYASTTSGILKEGILSLCQYHQWNPEGRYPLPMPVPPVESWRKVSSPCASTTSGILNEGILSLCQYHQWNPEGRYPLPMPVPPMRAQSYEGAAHCQPLFKSPKKKRHTIIT